MKPRRQRPKIGAILEITTSRGLVYLQYTHEHEWAYSVVGLLPGYHVERPTSFVDLVNQPERYVFQYFVPDAVRRGEMEVVGSEDVPERCKPWPWFRMPIEYDFENGLITCWRFGNHKESYQARTLTPELLRVPIHGIPSPVMLRERLESNWQPETDPVCNGRIPKRDPAADSAADEPAAITHFLSFKTKPPATAAGEALKAQGYGVAMRRDPFDRQWPWTVAATRADSGDLAMRGDETHDLTAIASAHGGQYDGHEVAV